MSPRLSLAAIACAVSALSIAACSPDKPAPPATAADSLVAKELADWKSKKAIADSVLSKAPSINEILREQNASPGKQGAAMYDVADDSLAAVVRRESEKTRYCYTNALKEHDPKLAGTVYMLVNFGAAGWDLVRAERSVWSSFAGGNVDACLNTNAKKEWQLPTKGVKAGAHLVQLTFRPDTTKPPGGSD